MQRKSMQNGNSNQAAGMFERPEDLTLCQTIGRFIYDSKQGKVFTRTPLSWAKIVVFFTIFYGCLAALSTSCMWVFLNYFIYPNVGPRWQLEESIIGTNPGMGVRPMSHNLYAGHTLLIVNSQFNTQLRYIEQLDQFLNPYRDVLGSDREVCDHQRSPRNRSLTSCTVDVSQWEPCTAANAYGYNHSAPCVFLKLNRIYNWLPEFYNSTEELPENMPKGLRDHITNISISEPEKMNMVWVSCDGELPDDKERIGQIKYIPEQGFPGYYYPYLNTEGYLSPLIAVQFVRPTVGAIVKIECKVWAKNLIYNHKESAASVKFQLFVE